MNLTLTQQQINGVCNKLFFSINNPQYFIFKKGSKTYFYSSLLFPKPTRNDISILYSFVRLADNFVDAIPQQVKEFNKFNIILKKGLGNKKTDNKIIDDFLVLVKNKGINHKWINAFMYSMKLDTKKTTYKNFRELDQYLYGSAEVIGLMMSKLLRLEKESTFYAKRLGKAMQFINFIRDIAEDNALGRTYIPQSELKKYNLTDLKYETALKHQKEFISLMREQITIYFRWQRKAEQGFDYIPTKYLVAIKTASDLYKWTAVQIYKDPFIVYSKKVKPSMSTIITHATQNVFKIYL